MLAVDYYFFTVFKIMLKLTSHDIMHYLWSADLSKSFSQLIVSIDCVNTHLFPIFFNRFYWVEKCGLPPHCLYRDSLILTNLTETRERILDFHSYWNQSLYFGHETCHRRRAIIWAWRQSFWRQPWYQPKITDNSGFFLKISCRLQN